MQNTPKIDVIIVGAGVSGIASAVSAKRAGLNPLVIEKSSHYGVKNMFGGAIYLNSVRELFPNLKIPYERILTKHNYVILNSENSLNIAYTNPKANSSATITRYAFDTALAQAALDEGVYFAKNTVVLDLIIENGKVKGVITENEKIEAPITIIAEGFNTFLAERAKLKTKTKPKDAILGIKEVIKLDKEVINQRFSLDDKTGALYQFFGGLSLEDEAPPLGMGFLYTFKNFVTIGAGVSMESLQKNKIKPYEYLERLKKHPFISNLIKDGEITEYSAHSIPEGGYRELPKLFSDGVLLVGDAAGLVDAPHFEGTNLAIKSGIIAGKTAALAFKKKDFSSHTLKTYKKELFKSFVINDLKTYKSVIHTLLKRRKSIFSYYPKKIDEFFEMFTSAKDTGKKNEYRKFLFSFFKERNLFEYFKDFLSFARCVFEAIF